jgi:hypothetical protein
MTGTSSRAWRCGFPAGVHCATPRRCAASRCSSWARSPPPGRRRTRPALVGGTCGLRIFRCFMVATAYHRRRTLPAGTRALNRLARWHVPRDSGRARRDHRAMPGIWVMLEGGRHGWRARQVRKAQSKSCQPAAVGRPAARHPRAAAEQTLLSSGSDACGRAMRAALKGLLSKQATAFQSRPPRYLKMLTSVAGLVRVAIGQSTM